MFTEPTRLTFVECYEETVLRFPGSQPHTLQGLAQRLYKEFCTGARHPMVEHEREVRMADLRIALQTIPEMGGLAPGERPANAQG